MYQIHLEALNPALPLVSRRLYDILTSTPASLRAQYLMRKYPFEKEESSTARLGFMVQASLRHPICDVTVVQAIHRLFDLEEQQSPHTSSPYSPQRFLLLELPKHIFRNLTRAISDQTQPNSTSRQQLVITMLHELRAHRPIYRINANSHRGYPLTMACHHGAVELIQLLLAMGADPEMKDALAVKVAIRKRNIDLVRMLVERTGDALSIPMAGGPEIAPGDAKRKRDDGDDVLLAPSGKNKRRRLSDRVVITSELVGEAAKADARAIVHYFVQEKGASPDLKTLDHLLRNGRK